MRLTLLSFLSSGNIAAFSLYKGLTELIRTTWKKEAKKKMEKVNPLRFQINDIATRKENPENLTPAMPKYSP